MYEIIERPEANGSYIFSILIQFLNGVANVIDTIYSFLFQKVEIKFGLFGVNFVNFTFTPWDALLFGGSAVLIGLIVYSILKP